MYYVKGTDKNQKRDINTAEWGKARQPDWFGWQEGRLGRGQELICQKKSKVCYEKGQTLAQFFWIWGKRKSSVTRYCCRNN